MNSSVSASLLTVPVDAAVPETSVMSMNTFLSGIEGPALRSAQIALGHREDALDAVQDAMLRLVRHYEQRPAAEWKPLFWSILRRRISDLRRRRKVRSIMVGWMGKAEHEGDTPAWEPPDLGPGPEQLSHDEQALQALTRAVQSLPRRQQEAFILRTMNDLDGAATAAAMGCSEGSVKTHLSRAMAALRLQLEDWQ
ncbi:MAG: RNA polymerase sigma factor [Xanthomonadales bacterium]|nr:RNA polymerase sigma factor [Xanthomonadales bacterium]